MNDLGLPKSEIAFADGVPCDWHIGCKNHKTHPCEGCGRTEARGIAYKKYNPMLKSRTEPKGAGHEEKILEGLDGFS